MHSATNYPSLNVHHFNVTRYSPFTNTVWPSGGKKWVRYQFTRALHRPCRCSESAPYRHEYSPSGWPSGSFTPSGWPIGSSIPLGWPISSFTPLGWPSGSVTPLGWPSRSFTPLGWPSGSFIPLWWPSGSFIHSRTQSAHLHLVTCHNDIASMVFASVY